MGSLFRRVSVFALLFGVVRVALLGGVQFSSEHYEITEDASELVLRFSLDPDDSQSSIVHFATMDGTALSAVDFLPIGGTVAVSAEQPDGEFTVSLVDDPRIDGAKEFSVRLFELSESQEVVILDEARVLIHDNEKRLVLDPRFQEAESGFDALAVQSDGRLLGTMNGVPVRLNLDGSLDRSFDVDFEPEPSENAHQWVSAMFVQEDGKILYLGETERYGINNFSISTWIRRLEIDGQPDPSYRAVLSRINFVQALVFQKDGSAVAAGFSENFNTGSSIARLMRVRSNGSLDPEFSTNNIFPRDAGGITSLAVRDSGVVLIGGGFSSVYGEPIHALAQLRADGSLDESFRADLKEGTSISSLLLQPDGKLVYAAFDPEKGKHLGRLLVDGSQDPGFVVTQLGSTNTRVELVQDEARDRIYVAGAFEQVNDRIWHKLLRLDGLTGAPDFTFGDSEAFSSTSVRRLLLMPDGGLFTGQGRVFTENTNLRAVSFDVPSATISEGDQGSFVSISRFGPSHEPLIATLRHELVGLQVGRDLGRLPSEIVFAPWETTIQLPFGLQDNSSVDAIRRLTLSVEANEPDDFTVAPAVWEGSIIDNKIRVSFPRSSC